MGTLNYPFSSPHHSATRSTNDLPIQWSFQGDGRPFESCGGLEQGYGCSLSDVVGIRRSTEAQCDSRVAGQVISGLLRAVVHRVALAMKRLRNL